MRHGRFILLPIVALALAISAWFLFGPPSELAYHGRSLSHWFRESCQPGKRGDRGLDALKEMGTNALPFLVDEAMNPAQDTALHDRLLAFLNKFAEKFGSESYPSREDRRKSAMASLWEIKPPVNTLLPRLVKPLAGSNTAQFEQAMTVLVLSGDTLDPVVPYCSRALQSTNWKIQEIALNVIEWAGPKAKASVPDLMRVFQNTDTTNVLSQRALHALGGIRSNAAPAIPLLSKSFAVETNWFRRS